jgi:PBP1b-binding outer membrane lipoprotein LpoB
MTISQMSGYLLVASGVVLLVGCSAWNGRPDSEVHVVSTPDMKSKSLTGAYPDVGPDGGIQHHPVSSNK